MNNRLYGKRLLILGGMLISCEIVKKAKEMGLITIVVDYNDPNVSPAKQIADENYIIDITNVNAVVSFIKGHHIDGVLVGFNDMLLPYYAEICERAGLPAYGNKKQFELLINKRLYKQICRDFNVPVIEEYSDYKKIKYPVLVKPTDDSGSRGISICTNKSELEKGINKAIKQSKTGDYIVERYMSGEEVTIFWIFVDGNYYLSAMADRCVRNYHGQGVLPQPIGYYFPSKHLLKYQSEIEGNAKRMFNELDLKNGMMFMQCKIDEGIPYLYDLGFRLTGSLEYKLIEEICGFNPLAMLISFAITGRMCDENISNMVNPNFNKTAFNVSCLCGSGTIKKYVGLENVRKKAGIVDVITAHKIGDTISNDMIGTLSQIAIRVLGVCQSQESFIKILNGIIDNLSILSQDGKDLLLRE